MENQFFNQVREGLKAKKTEDEFKPFSVDDALELPMTPEDHVLSLRYKIHEFFVGAASLPVDHSEADKGFRYLKDEEMPKPLNELLSQELCEKYEAISVNFKKIAREGKFVDIESEDVSAGIEQWIGLLIVEMKGKVRGKGLDEADLQELEGQCWLLFEAMANVINTETMQKEIAAYYEGKKLKKIPDDEKRKLKEKCVEELTEKYPLSKNEVEILVDLMVVEGSEEYSFKILVETIARLWKEYQVGDQKKIISKISAGNLVGQAAMSYAPSLLEGVMEDGKFNLMAFLEFMGLNKIGDLFDLSGSVRVAELAKVIGERVNERITNSLFFQEFEFVQGQTFGEVYSKLENGKRAAVALIVGAVTRLIPTVAGLMMSLIFLTKINPVLGAIGLASLPVMFQTAKKSNRKIWEVYEGEIEGEAEVATSLGSVKQAVEEIRTSPDVVSVQKHVKGLLDKKDSFSMEKMRQQAIARFKQILPFDVGQAVAAVAGFILQQMGEISGSAVLANTFYAERLNGPIYRLVNLYFEEFSRYVQDVKKMEEVLGKYENLDLPEGEKEKERVDVEQLDNLDISLRGVNFRGILKDVNLDIREGEFVTIVGDSGGGKSTLLRLLAGLYKPDEGVIEVGGTELQKIKKYGPHSIYSRMSYCNQNPQIFENLTLRENLVLWSKAEISDDKIVKVMQDLQLGKFVDKLDSKVKNLSGGERVRVGLARTLLKGAQILLLDEPTASLDSASSVEVRRIIESIRSDYPEVTIICVTHDDKLMAASQRRLDINDLQRKAA